MMRYEAFEGVSPMLAVPCKHYLFVMSRRWAPQSLHGARDG